MAVMWGRVLVALAIIIAGTAYLTDFHGVQEDIAVWWAGDEQSTQIELQIQTQEKADPVTYKVNNNGIIETWTQKPGNDYEVIDGIFVRTKQGSSDELLDPPTLKVVEVQEKSEWTNPDGLNLPEIIQVGSKVLYLQGNVNTEFGAITLESLVNSDDGFQQSFKNAKEESFATYLRNSESLWGDAAGKWIDEDGKYVAYLVKISAGKYGAWYTSPDTTSGNVPNNKDDLKSITPYKAESAPAKEQTSAVEEQPSSVGTTTPGSASEVAAGRGSTTTPEQSAAPTSAAQVAAGRPGASP